MLSDKSRLTFAAAGSTGARAEHLLPPLLLSFRALRRFVYSHTHCARRICSRRRRRRCRSLISFAALTCRPFGRGWLSIPRNRWINSEPGETLRVYAADPTKDQARQSSLCVCVLVPTNRERRLDGIAATHRLSADFLSFQFRIRLCLSPVGCLPQPEPDMTTAAAAKVVQPCNNRATQ